LFSRRAQLLAGNEQEKTTMSSPFTDHDSSRDAHAVASIDTSASSGGGTNPLWLLVAAGALFFAVAAAFLASG
jgi:hypothetical protein